MNVKLIFLKVKMALFRKLAVICLMSPLFFVAITVDSKSNSAINEYLESIYVDGAPGAAVLVAKCGKILFEKTYGLSDVELGKNIESNMVFRIGSLTKQITAAGVLLLEERGHINISDTVSDYLPGLITNGENITIEHLLTHTSGIGDFDSLEGTMMETVDTKLEVMDVIGFFATKPSQFTVGSEYRYSNPGYIVLGAIIEKVSGRTFSQFIRSEILLPLKMENTYFNSSELPEDKMVQGYHREEAELVKAYKFNVDIPYSAGGLLSTIRDVAKWNEGLWSGKIISTSSLAKMTTPFVLNDGNETKYGYGVEVLSQNGRKLTTHQGGIFGFQSVLTTIPSEDLNIIIMTNTDNPDIWPSDVMEKIVELLLKE